MSITHFEYSQVFFQTHAYSRRDIGVALAISIPFLHHAEIAKHETARQLWSASLEFLEEGTDVECDSGKASNLILHLARPESALRYDGSNLEGGTLWP